MSLQPLTTNESTTYFFNARELARLSVYRAAVLAGFYTDKCELPRSRYEVDAARLLDAVRHDAPLAA